MSRYHRDSDSEDDRFRRTTVTRYKVAPDRYGQRYERTERIEVDDDRRSKYSGRNSGDLFDGRSHILTDRSRSALEPFNGDRSRTAFYEKDERDDRRDVDRSRITVYESKETDVESDRRSHIGPGRPEEEMRMEKRVEERFDDNHGHDMEHYRRETEYYVPQSPAPAPVIIRQQSSEPQRIYVHDAPPAPIVLHRQQPGAVVVRDREKDREVVRRDREPHQDDYYYRYDRRQVGPYRGERERERDYAVTRYDRRPHPRNDDYYSDDDDYYYRRTVRRDRSESPHHKRHLAEGALAGAGISAILNSRRDNYGDLPENRGRKVLAGAALGALGTEVARRAHSAYEERFGDDRESPDHHHLLKKGLGVAAVALAAAGAAKYLQANKVDKEEAHRGRSRTRGYHSGDDGDYSSRSLSRSPRASRSRSRRRSLSTAAKAGLGALATAGLIKHVRNQSKSKSRRASRSRSKSRLRTAAEIGGVAAAAGVAGKLWKDNKEKKERARERSRSVDDDYYRSQSRRHSRARPRSLSRSTYRSRSRSMVRSPYSPSGADPELGLVEYGNDPLYPESRAAAATAPRQIDAVAEEEEEEQRRRERRRRRRRDRSASYSGSDEGQGHERKRSKSRLRDMAAAGAAAIGIKEFKDRHDRRSQEKRERRSRDRNDDPRRYNEDMRRDYFDDGVGPRSRSPPTASGGAYYPPYPPTPGGPPAASGANYASFPDSHEADGGASVHTKGYRPYMPQDYTGYVPPEPPPPPPPAGPPPSSATGFRSAEFSPGPPPPPAGPPPTSGIHAPDHVSDRARSRENPVVRDGGNDGMSGRRRPSNSSGGPPPTVTKSVSFIPLSPKSSMTMERHRREHLESLESQKRASHTTDDSKLGEDEDDDGASRNTDRVVHQRSPSDLAYHRALVHKTRQSSRKHDQSYNIESGSGSVSGSDSTGSEVEVLPDRFDSQGQRLDGGGRSQDRWTTRRGTFHRPAQRPGGWEVQGAWQASGTDEAAVDQLMRDVTSILDGRKSWVSLLGDVLGSGLLPGPRRVGSNDEDYEVRGQARQEGQNDGQRRRRLSK